MARNSRIACSSAARRRTWDTCLSNPRPVAAQWKAGSGNVDWRTRTARFRPLSKRAFPGLAAGIHVSALFVFTVVVHVSNRLLEFVLSHRHLVGVVGQGS